MESFKPERMTPKDVVLYIINKLGVKGGIGYAYEYAGQVFDAMTMEGRMTVCNMAIEGGARAGYVNPDQVTFDYLKVRENTRPRARPGTRPPSIGPPWLRTRAPPMTMWSATTPRTSSP